MPCRANSAKLGIDALRKPLGQRMSPGSGSLEVIISDDELSDGDEDDQSSLAKTSARSSASDATIGAALASSEDGSSHAPDVLSLPCKPDKATAPCAISLTASSAAAALQASPGSQDSGESALTTERTPTKIPRAPQNGGLVTPPSKLSAAADARFGGVPRARTPASREPGSATSSVASRCSSLPTCLWTPVSPSPYLFNRRRTSLAFIAIVVYVRLAACTKSIATQESTNQKGWIRRHH